MKQNEQHRQKLFCHWANLFQKSGQPTAHAKAARWVFACTVAALCGVCWAYYWRVFYYLDARVPAVQSTAVCVLAALAAVGGTALVRYVARNFAAKAALCIALCGLLFVFANPPMQTPDESQYFLRCESISRGHFDFDADRGYPQDVTALYAAFPGAWVNAHTSQGMQEAEDSADTGAALLPPQGEAGEGEPKFYTTAGCALKQYGEDGAVQSIADSFAEYFANRDAAPAQTAADEVLGEPLSFLIVPFLPQALGMALARLLGFAALGQFYAGRMANLAMYTLLCWAALKATRRFRPVFLAVMLLPLSLFMAGSLSYDATLLGCYFLMAALLTRHVWNSRTAAEYLAACVFVNIAKPYLNLLWGVLPLVLPLAAWQSQKRGEKPTTVAEAATNSVGTQKPRLLWTAGMLGGSVAITLLTEWYGRVFRLHYPEVIARMGGQDVNQMAQLLFVLKNPLRYLAVLAGTLYENDFFIGQLGLFGWKDLPIPFLNLTGPVVLAAAAVLGAAASAAGQQNHSTPELGRRRHAGFWLFCVLYGVGAMTAMYITYTPVTMIRIVGFQARYLLPVWLFGFVLVAQAVAKTLRPALKAEHAETLSLRLFAPYAALGAVLLFQHYWVGPIATIF